MKFREIMKLEAHLAPPRVVGHTPWGNRMIYPAASGVVSGPGIQGKLLSGGGDWSLVGTDGADIIGAIDVRVVLEVEPGDGRAMEIVYARYPGYIRASQDILQKLANGQPVNPDDYYFRTTPVFEADVKKSFSYLNGRVHVGVGEKNGPQINYTIYQIL